MLEPVIPFIIVVANTVELEQSKDIYKPSQLSLQRHFSSFSEHYPAHYFNRYTAQ